MYIRQQSVSYTHLDVYKRQGLAPDMSLAGAAGITVGIIVMVTGVAAGIIDVYKRQVHPPDGFRG